MELFTADMPFWKGNTHAHTTRSDGRRDPKEVISFYREAGYDFLALTDHRLLGDDTHMDGDMLLLSGLEMDYTYDLQVLHMTAIGVDEGFRSAYSHGGDPQKDIALARKHGGRVMLCHPAWSLNTPEFMMSFNDISGVEIYNTMSDAPWNAARADSSGVLDLAAARGWLTPHIAADDSHFYQGEQCVSATMVQAKALTWESLRDAIDKGRFYATQGPTVSRYAYDGERVIVECSPVDRIIFCSNAFWYSGRCHAQKGITSATHTVREDETFVRCVLVDAQGRSAWLSPINTKK